MKESGNLENFLERELKDEHRKQDVFKRLIGTLLDKELLTYRGDSPFPLIPFNEDEYSNFGQEKWRGSLTIKRFNDLDQEILAYSHAVNFKPHLNQCIDGHEHWMKVGLVGGYSGGTVSC